MDRALLLSHPQFFHENFNLIVNILLDNNYPLKFIFNVINQRMNYYIHKNTKNTIKNNNNKKGNQNRFFALLYVNIVSDKLKFIIKKYEFRATHTINNSLKRFIKKHKDKNEKLTNCNIIYKIPCGAIYVGQSKRQMKTRLKEHRNAVKRGNCNSVISNHCVEYDHMFDWDNVEIPDIERYYNLRLMSEMISVRRQKNDINIQSDTDSLLVAYNRILCLFPPL